MGPLSPMFWRGTPDAKNELLAVDGRIPPKTVVQPTGAKYSSKMVVANLLTLRTID